jgi:stage II sporulation protein M
MRIVKLFGISILVWLLGFVTRLIIEDEGLYNVPETSISKENQKKVKAIDYSHNFQNFKYILGNNAMASISLILGFITLGSITIFGLGWNGFIVSDAFMTERHFGNSFINVFNKLLPHSSELIAIWLSGSIGIFISILVLKAVVKQKFPDKKDLKILMTSFCLIVICLVISAYLEAYISIGKFAKYEMEVKWNK